MSYTVLIPQQITRPGEEYLEEKGYQIKRGSKADEQTMMEEAADCDAILIRAAKLTAKVMDAAPKLKIIARHGVGVDNIDVGYAEKKGIWVTNAPLSNYNAVAEQAILLILGCAKHSRIIDLHFRADDYYIGHRVMSLELKGKTLGILGLGKIGTSLAKKAHLGFEMSVIGYDPYAKPENLPEYVELKGSMQEVLRRADFVSVHMPLTPETKKLIGLNEIKLMKPTAFLVNTARGGIIDEEELVEALKQKVIAGGAFDFLEKDPPEITNPLFQFENVIITPHNAAITYEAMDRMGLHAAQGIHEVLSGKRPSWPVNQPFKK